MEQLLQLQEGDILVLAGSIPGSMPKTIYRDILARLEHQGIRCVVDASGELLAHVLEYHPFLIKPNHHELGDLYGVEFTQREAMIPYAKKLQEAGARNVLVSMGARGAILVDAKGEVHSMDAPEGDPVNAVGAGDSMVAGFLTGWIETGDYHKAFQMGLAAGTASACSEEMADRAAVEKILNRLSQK